MKKLLCEITFKDCQWSYFKGSGKGGQKRNKTENCAKCTHESGAQTKAEEGRSQFKNKQKAFFKLINNEDFRNWAYNLAKDKNKSDRKLSFAKEDSKILIYDMGPYIEPKRKKKQRKPVEKDKNKQQRQESKKITKQYL